MNVRKVYIFRILEASNLETVHARLFIVTRNFGIYKLTIAIRCISNILWNIGNIPTKPNLTFFMKLAATQETSIYVWFLNKSKTFRQTASFQFNADLFYLITKVMILPLN